MCGPNRRMPISSAHRTRTLAADLAMGIGVSFTACQAGGSSCTAARALGPHILARHVGPELQ
jgi:hypothetical protein